MENDVKNSFLLLTLILVVFISLSSVYAADLDDATLYSTNDDNNEFVSIETPDDGYSDDVAVDDNDEKLGHTGPTGGSYLVFDTEDYNITEGEGVTVTGHLKFGPNADEPDQDCYFFSLKTTLDGTTKQGASLSNNKMSYNVPSSWLTAKDTPYILKFIADEDNEYEIFLEESGGAYFADSWVTIKVNPVAPAALTEAYVDGENGDDENTGTSDSEAFKTIKHALSVIGDNGVIYLIGNNNMRYEEDEDYAGITIDKDVSIIGIGDEEVVIDGGNEGRIFNIGACTVYLSNISFVNAIAPESDKHGGAIRAEGTTLTIDNCEFRENSAGDSSSYGGALYVKSSTTTVKNSNFWANSAYYNGGAIQADNPNILLNISNCIFTENRVTNSGWAAGGAISSYGTVIIDRSKFYGNELAEGKNGRTINQYDGSLTITNSILLDGDKSVYAKTPADATVENNWWGNNETTKDSKPKDLGYTNVDVTSSAYLKLSAPSTLETGTPVDINIKFASTDSTNLNFPDVGVSYETVGGVFDVENPYDMYFVMPDGNINLKYTSSYIGDNSIWLNIYGVENTYILNFKKPYDVGQVVPSIVELDTGVVSGNAMFIAINPGTTTGSLVFTVPEGITNLKTAMAVINIYSGSGAPTYALYSNVTLNTNNGLEVLGYEKLFLDKDVANDPNVYGINDHTTKQYSDYQMVYDITGKVNNLKSGDTITINVANSEYPGKLLDGRIKLISLFFAYDDGDEDNIAYWLNAGQVWTAGTTDFNIKTKDYSGETYNMTLRSIALSSSAASSYKINNVESAPDETISGWIYKYLTWKDVGTNFNKGSNTNFQFTTGGASYKTNVALLVASDKYEPELLTEAYVDYANGLDTNLGSSIKPFKTIQHALDVTADNAVIYIRGVNYLDDIGVNGLSISKNLNIVGDGDNAVIDANNAGRIFNINGVNVNLTNLVFANANAADTSDKRGGAIWASNAVLNIDNCKFINNTGGPSGSYSGGLNLKTSTATVKDSYFEGNTAYYAGAAINAESGNKLLNVSNCVFTENAVLSTGWATGGAICSYGTVIIDRSTFYGNKLAEGKNGRSINQYDGSLTITNSILLDGDKSVYAKTPADATVENNWWGNNDTTKDSNPKDLGYTNANVDSYAYLNVTMFAKGLDVGDTSSVFVNLLPNGDNVLALPDIPVTIAPINGTMDHESTTIKNGVGSAVYTISSVGNNGVTVDVLGIKETYTLSSSDVISTKVIYVNSTGGSDLNSGISWDNALQSIEKAISTVDANGTIYVADGNYYLADETSANGIAITKDVSIFGESTNAVISGNNAKRIFTIDKNSKLTIRNLTLTQGRANGNGGAIYLQSSGNTGTITSAKLVISDSVISDCYATTTGGAIGTDYGRIDSINNVTFIRNGAGNSGGAIGLNYGNGVLVLGDDCKFIESYANGRGGAICTWKNLVMGKNNFFYANEAKGSYGYGGAVFGTAGIQMGTGNVFVNNKATQGGALWSNNGAMSGSYAIFINNTGANGNTITLQSNNVAVNFNYCYWGSNAPDFAAISNSKKFTHNNYLVLNISAENSKVPVGDSTLITVDLTKDYQGGSVDVDSLPDLPLVFTVVNGNVDPVETTLVKGIATATFAPDVVGNASVTANIYAASETVNLTAYADEGIIFVDYTNGLDTNDGSDWNNAVKTIAHALEIVKDGKTIFIADGVNYLDGIDVNGLSISKNLNIVGVGDSAVIDANNAGRIFYIDGVNVNFTNLVFANANVASASDKRGGAIWARNTVLNIDDCKFINNTAGPSSSYGGALNLKTSTATVKDSYFEENTAFYCGAGINAESGNLLLNVSNCVFTENAVLNTGWAAGGAICSYGTVIIDRSTFYGNKLATGKNGRSINQYGTDRLTITNSILLDGDKSVYAATPSATTVENNWWGNTDLNRDSNPKDLGYTTANVNTYYYLNLSEDNNEITIQLLSNDGSDVNILDIPVIVTATSGSVDPSELTLVNGYGVTTFTPGADSTSTVTVDALGVQDSIIISSEIIDYKNIYVDYAKGSNTNSGMSWDNAVKTIEKALALVEDGGTIHIAEGTTYLEDSTPATGIAINKNVLIVGQSLNSVVSGNDAKRIFTVKVGSKLTIENLTLTEGRVKGGALTDCGGAIYIEDGGNTNPIVAGKLDISNAIISNSKVDHIIGGAIGWYRAPASDILINNVTFINNYAADSGGAIGSLYAVAIGDNCKFINNSAPRASVVYSQKSITIGNNNYFENNIATGSGSLAFATGSNNIVIGTGNVFINNVVKSAVLDAVNGYVKGSYAFFINNTGSYVISGSTASSLEYCYWDTNDPDFSTISGKTFAHDNYLVLGIKSDKDSIRVGENATITVNLTNQNGEAVNIGLLPEYLPITFTSTNGDVSVQSTKLVDAAASTEYTATIIGTGVVTANLYDGSASVEINLLPAAGTVFVDYANGLDTNDGSNWDSAVKTIEKALSIVGDNRVIYVADGVNYLDNLDVNGLNITKNIAIIGIGDNVVIDANNAGRIFNINGVNVNLTNLVFANANVTGASDKRGGAIWASNTVLNIDDCKFINNTAGNLTSSYGGAINLKASTTTIKNSYFDSNSVRSTGAGINAENSNVLLNISGCVFTNNLLMQYGWSAGAAICSYNTVIIDSSVFYNNKLTDNTRKGRTINQYGTGSLTITNSVLLDGENSVYVATPAATTVENNWWGNTDLNRNSTPKDLGYTNADVENYLVLTTTLDKEIAHLGDTVGITVALNQNQNGEKLENVIELPLTLDVNLGKVEPNSTTLIAQAQATYTPINTGNELLKVNVLGVESEYQFVVKDEMIKVSVGGVTTPWSSGIFAAVNNTLTIKINNNDDREIRNLTVELYSDDTDELLASYTFDSIEKGTSTISLTDPTIRELTPQTVWPAAQDNKVKFTINLKYDDEVVASSSVDKMLAYNGYLNKTYAYGGHDNIINRNYTISGDIIISTQDVSVYADQYSRFRNETWNIETPDGAEIVKVLLYFHYNWDTSFFPNGWNLSFNGNEITNDNITFEKDRGNLGYYGAYDYGLVVFDVTDYYEVNADNSFVITKTSNCALYPSTLVVLYNMTGSDKTKDVYFSDVCDVYYPYYNSNGYDDMLKTVVYFNGIDLRDLNTATLYAFGASGGNNDASLSFNNETYENAYKQQGSNDCYPFVVDVTDLISQNNEAWFITSAKSSTVVAYEQILVIARPFENELIIPDNLTAGEETNITFTVPRDAEGEVTISVGGVDYPAEIIDGKATVTVDGLAAGNHTIVAVYSGDDYYKPVTVISKLEVNKADPTMSIDVDSVVVGETAIVTVTVPDNAVGYILIDVEDMSSFTLIEEGQAVFEITTANAGNCTVTAIFAGDENYNNKTVSATLVVGKASTTAEADIPVEAVVGEDIEFVVSVLPEEATGNVTVYVDGEEYGTFGIDEVITVAFDKDGNHTVGVRYDGDENYNASEIAEYEIEVSKVDVSEFIEIEGSTITYGENATVILSGLPEDATGTVTVTIGDNNYTADVEDGIAIVEIPGLDADIYELFSVEYSGDDKYTSATGMATIEVKPLFIDWFMDCDDVYIDANETVFINIYDVTEGAEGSSLNVTINGEEYGIYSLDDMIAGIDLTGFSEPGTYVVEVAFLEDPNFEFADPVELYVIVNTLDPEMDIDVPEDAKVGEVANVTVTLPDDATGNVTVFVDGKEVDTVPVEDGKATFSAEGLTAGNHTVSVVYSGDDKYSPVISEDLNLEVAKADPSIVVEVDDITVGNNATITITVPDDATGYVLVEVSGKQQFAEVNGGVVTVTVSDLAAGDYKATVKLTADDKYNEATNSTSFKVNKVEDYNMTINSTNADGKTTVDVELPSDAAGEVTVTDSNGNNYTTPVKDGKASVDVTGLPEGENDVTVSYSGDDKYDARETAATINVTKTLKETILSGGKLEMTVGDGSKFTVTLTDKSGNPIAGKGIKITIAGKTYTVKTDKNGVAALPINLKAGSYPVTATFNGDANYNASNVVSTSVEVYTDVRIVQNADLVKDYKDDSKPFKVRALDKYGKPVGANAKVKMTVAGKTYNVYTDANGYASLAINLGPGTYQITCEYGGTKVTNQITVRKK